MSHVGDKLSRHRLVLALARSEAMQCFSRLIATDVELLQRAQEHLEADQEQQTAKLMQQQHQLVSQAAGTPASSAPLFVFGATALSPSPAAPSVRAPGNTASPPLFLPSYQWVQRQRVRLYHSVEAAARMLRWMFHAMSLASGSMHVCGCQLCRTSLDTGAAASRSACGQDPDPGQRGSSGAGAAGVRSAGQGAGSGCLLLQLWKALHESALLEHLVAGSLALYGQPDAWDTDSCGGGNAGGCSGGANDAGAAAGGTGVRVPGHAGGGSREQLAAAERACLASRMRLEQQALAEYQMYRGDSALQVVLQLLPGGLPPPAADHPAYPHIRACMAGPGCRLALNAALVAAVCAEDGGRSYGLPYSSLTAALGGAPLVVAARAGARQGPASMGEAWQGAMQSNMVVVLRRKLEAWITLGPESWEGLMFNLETQPPHGPAFAVAVCRRLVTLCLDAWGEGEWREGAAADGAGFDETAMAEGEGGWRWLRDVRSQKLLAQLVTGAMRSSSWIMIYEQAQRSLGELHAGLGAAGRAQANTRELAQGVLRGSQWTPVWWWRLAMRAMPWLLTASPGALADPRDAHLRIATPLLLTTASTPPPNGEASEPALSCRCACDRACSL